MDGMCKVTMIWMNERNESVMGQDAPQPAKNQYTTFKTEIKKKKFEKKFES